MIAKASNKENLITYAISACKIIKRVLKEERYSINIATRNRDFTNKLREAL